MCVRIALDMDIFATLTERNGPVSLDDLAAVKKASPILVGKSSSIGCPILIGRLTIEPPG